mmetsp:Transcript_88886/g.229289  ORF Transcript_88886/g.229289 Transcript_88886/m.229289 type:complete len:206 (-) Transcript_88886:1-618(-)
MSRGWSRALRTILAALALSSATSGLFGLHLQTRPKVPSPSGPWPTNAYRFSNCEESWSNSSSTMLVSRNKFEQLSSRTKHCSLMALSEPTASRLPASPLVLVMSGVSSGAGLLSMSIWPATPPRQDRDAERIGSPPRLIFEPARPCMKASDRQLMDGRRSRIVGAKRSLPSAAAPGASSPLWLGDLPTPDNLRGRASAGPEPPLE